ERSGTETGDRRTLAPGRREKLGERAVGGEHEARQEQRPEGDRSADLAKERRRDLGDRPAHVATRDVVAHVVPRQSEERDDHDDPAGDREHRLPSDEPEPELERDSGKSEGHEEGGPAEEIELYRAPPVQHRTLIGGERDGGKDRERDDGDG